MQHHFIIGCGYVGTQLAQYLLHQQQTVIALTHSDPQRLTQLGIETQQGDLDAPSSLSQLPTADSIIYYLAPPPRAGTQDPRLQNFLQAITELPRKLVLISTTGVYGDCQGAWIDESQPLNPRTDRAKRRVAAEKTLQDWASRHSIDTVILRVPGIYGAQRLPIARLQQGLPVLAAEYAPYSNRIYVKDLVQACAKAGHSAATGIFNVSDGHPTTMTDYFNQVATTLQLPLPPVVDWATAQQCMSPDMLSFLNESKRINNHKLCEKLNIILQYPDLASGLADCLNPT